ncbi:MAG TPA: DUF2188 domain-containing protein [Pseudomonas sp.]|nr:DUF2188 domain-containing protein [Pseudomonas sp.]
MSIYRITRTERGWELRKQGATRASKTATSQAEILRLAADFLKDRTATLVIHDPDGHAVEERTYPRQPDQLDG